MKLPASLAASFVIVIGVGMYFSGHRHESHNNIILGQVVKYTPTPTKSLNPIRINDFDAPILTAASAVVMDIVSGKLLLEKDIDNRLYPASTTKLATALVAMDYYPMEKVLTVGNMNVIGQKMRLVPGEQMTVESLIKGLLMFSANDAAEVLASNFPGGRENFVSAMNLKVHQLGLTDTVFDNPSGLDDPKQYTTAIDLARMGKYAIERPLVADIVKTKKTVVSSMDGKVTHNITNINELLGKEPGVLGIKTGWTENAKENLVTYIERDGGKLIIVVLGSDDRFGETKTIIDWIYSTYRFN